MVADCCGAFFVELLGASLLFVFFVVEFWRSTPVDIHKEMI